MGLDNTLGAGRKLAAYSNFGTTGTTGRGLTEKDFAGKGLAWARQVLRKPVPLPPAPERSPVPQEGLVELGDDRVRVQLGDDEVRICEAYEVECSVFTQPAAFALTLGHPGLVGDLWRRYPPRTPFRLYVGDRLVQSGYTDERSAGGASSTLSIKGRDHLQEIHDSYAAAEHTFSEKKHSELIKSVFRNAGLVEPEVILSNEANRKAMALGKRLAPQAAKEEITIARPVQMSLGDTYYGFLKRVLDRAGLFMYAAPKVGTNGNPVIILSAPDKDQQPLYRLVHASAEVAQVGDVTDYHIVDSTTGRQALYIVYSRGGGRLRGRQKYKDGFPDEEMLALGYNRVRTFRDWHLQSNDQANLMARRKIAEARRKSWQLRVTVSGHTTTALTGGRAIWTPDTMVRFESAELGLGDNFYIETVRFRRSMSGTTTEMVLLRPEDLIFGSEDA